MYTVVCIGDVEGLVQPARPCSGLGVCIHGDEYGVVPKGFDAVYGFVFHRP